MFRGGLKVGEIFITEGDQLEQLKNPKDSIYPVAKEIVQVCLKIL